VRQPVDITTRTSEDTAALAARFARSIPAPHESAAIVHLRGDLGSGKTTFARGVVRALGVTGTVRSPSYTLLERYETDARVVVHLDLYRLQDPAELEQLGLRELDRPGHLWLIEWPERGGTRLPAPDVCVELEAGADKHRLRLSARSAFGSSWLERLQSS
jgi:tRNA threonylcarbamoyladenosine biosynthesis protein TsaE